VTELGLANLMNPPRPRLLVFGGPKIIDFNVPPTPTDPSINTYESFIPPPLNSTTGTWESPPQGRLFRGPRWSTTFLDSPLDTYPRMFLLSNGYVFMAGMHIKSAWVDHVNAPGIWPCISSGCDPTNVPFTYKLYNSCVLLPMSAFDLTDIVMSTGGDWGGPQTEVESIQFDHIPGDDPSWQLGPPMNVARGSHNAVLLPDGSVFVHGGSTNRHAEILKNGTWTVGTGTNQEDSPRGYHSTAILLPSGRVLSASEDNRLVDYQVYEPPYICSGQPRPTWVSWPSTLAYWQQLRGGLPGLAHGSHR
jgi:hypothetical protein